MCFDGVIKKFFRYTRNLVDEGNGKFNLIVLCWGEGQGRLVQLRFTCQM